MIESLPLTDNFFTSRAGKRPLIPSWKKAKTTFSLSFSLPHLKKKF